MFTFLFVDVGATSKNKVGEDLLPSSTSILLSWNGSVMSGKRKGWKQALVLG